MGEQRVAFEEQLAQMKTQMEEQMGITTQASDSVRREADNARQNEEQIKRELVEVKRREIETRVAAESKAHEKMWYPVTSDATLATVPVATATLPART
eukprot:2541250-Alexandrium_andersonii.AAC.1